MIAGYFTACVANNVACVAWRFKQFELECTKPRKRAPAKPCLTNLSGSAQSVKAAKTSGEAARNQLSLSQAPRGFGALYRDFPAFLGPSNCLKTTKLCRQLTTV